MSITVSPATFIHTDAPSSSPEARFASRADRTASNCPAHWPWIPGFPWTSVMMWLPFAGAASTPLPGTNYDSAPLAAAAGRPRHTGVVTGPDSPPAEKRVTWAELFFDLVFVFAVTEVAALLAHDRSGAGLLRAVIVFVPCYWLWVGTSIQVNQRDISRPSLRVEVFAVALAAIFMALAVPRAYTGLGLLFALAYWAGRIVLGEHMLRGRSGGGRCRAT